MPTLPMFPLGSVLFPAMPLPLRVFEERYLALLAAVLPDDPAEFGVVLIERGQEVGGGDTRFDVGTVARIVELEAGEGSVIVLALGERRFEVVAWSEDEGESAARDAQLPETTQPPYPLASVRDLDRLVWRDDLQALRDEAERTVRAGLAAASEYLELAWSPDVELDQDPIDAIWQLAAIAPLGPLDQIELLRATDPEHLLRAIIDATQAAVAALRFGWTDGRNEGDETETGDQS